MEHKEEINERDKQRYWENREKKLANVKEYRENNKEKEQLRHKIYYDKVKEREQLRNYNRRQKLLNKLGKNCTHCGFSDWRALQIDHINNNGYDERKRESATKTYRRILAMSDEEARKQYQILCANCNWIKKHETNPRFER